MALVVTNLKEGHYGVLLEVLVHAAATVAGSDLEVGLPLASRWTGGHDRASFCTAACYKHRNHLP